MKQYGRYADLMAELDYYLAELHTRRSYGIAREVAHVAALIQREEGRP